MKDHIIMEQLVDKKCLAHTSSSIDSHELGSAAIIAAFEFCYLILSSYYLTHKPNPYLLHKGTTNPLIVHVQNRLYLATGTPKRCLVAK